METNLEYHKRNSDTIKRFPQTTYDEYKIYKGT